MSRESLDLEDLHKPQRCWMDHEKEVPTPDPCPDCQSTEGRRTRSHYWYEGDALYSEHWEECVTCGQRIEETK